MSNLVVRRGKFDAAHRLLENASPCRNLHGHEYSYELAFSWSEAGEEGFAIDFADIKKAACAWFDRVFDHAFIANPRDEWIPLCKAQGLRIYEMHLGGGAAFCNPTAENIAKEMFYACEILLNRATLRISHVKLHETRQCFVVCSGLSQEERQLLNKAPLRSELEAFLRMI